MFRRCSFRLASFVLAALLCTAPAFAANTVPTKITSDSMSYEMSGGQVTFTGNVLVERPDFTIRSESIIVHFSPDPTGKKPAEGAAPQLDPGRIERIVAKGNVRIEREDKLGLCSQATYLVAQGLLKMEGNPVLRDGKNRINGEVIKLYIKDNRSEIIGSKTRRVEAVFTSPESLTNGK